MSSSQHFSVGTIGAGTLAQAIAGHAVAAGHRVIFSNSRGPESLEPLTSRFGANASAGTVAEAARADIVILAVGWEQVPAAVKDVPDWNGRIVIDATNQWQDSSRGIAADLGDQTGSERNAALMPGARVDIPRHLQVIPATETARTGAALGSRRPWPAVRHSPGAPAGRQRRRAGGGAGLRLLPRRDPTG